MSGTRVVVLGSGTPNAEADRAGPGIAIVVDGQPWLVDCGHGVVQRVVQAQARGIIDWSTPDLTRLCLTHLHADHTVGLPDLLFTPWIHGRSAAVRIWGPAATHAMIDDIQRAWQQNTDEHLKAHPASQAGFRARVQTMTPGAFHAEAGLTIAALPAEHGDLEAYSYKFVTDDRIIVVSGDTKPVPGFAAWAGDCDILIHEVYSAARFPERSPEWQRYHSRVHTSTTELAKLASAIRPRLLLLVHQLFWGASPAELVAEVRAGYDGDVVSANDLDVF